MLPFLNTMTEINATSARVTKTSHQPVLESLTIWPHRSLSKNGFVILMLILGGLLFTIGIGFFLAGAWPVVGFLGLELLVVWSAFKLNYRSAMRRETIETTRETLTVQTASANGTSRSTKFPLGWLRVKLTPTTKPDITAREQQRLILFSHGVEKEIGAFLHPSEKPALEREVHKMVLRSREVRNSENA